MTPAYTDYYLLTGATGAIGKEIARHLASQGKKIILACRNTHKAENLRQSIMEEFPQCQSVIITRLDLADENSVREFVKDIKRINSLSAIINNAGVMNRHYGTDNLGREMTMVVNYANTKLLNELLKDKVRVGGVIVFTTSLTRFLHRRNDYPVKFPAKEYSQLGTYGRSKRMITEYSRHLAEELKSRKIRVNCADPGIVDTGMISMDRWYDRLADIFFRPFIRSPRHGAIPAIRATEAKKTSSIFCRHLTHSI